MPRLILQLLLFYIAGIGGVNLTIVNKCSQRIWAMAVTDKGPVISGSGGDLREGSSVSIQIPDGWKWNGRVWGKTGCIFNESGSASCATGDNPPFTLAEFALQSYQSVDFYDVSLVDGFNLPLVIQPSGGCAPAGCIEDLNRRCPADLRTKGGDACRGPCAVFQTPEFCCNNNASCGPTSYSRLFKEVCPKAYTYPMDDPNSTFTCSAAAQYFITFCPANNSSFVQVWIAPAPTPEGGTGNPLYDAGGELTKKVIIAVALGVAGIILISISIHCYQKRRHSSNQQCKHDVENFLLQQGSLTPKRYRYSEIKKITKFFSHKLGQGGYGSVYKGLLPDGRPVAVKILTEADSNGEEFVNEVASISRTCHVNIVALLGFCYERNRRALVYEFMPNSSLDKFLNHNQSADIMDLEKLYMIAVGVAKGLEYLHNGCTTRIVHFDIKPQNILLDEDLRPKISDFGLAKLCKKKQSILSVLGTRGTAGYIAPEVFSRNFGGVSHKSDVYSYGMMLLEMAGAKKGIQAEANQSSENYFPDKIYEQVIMDVTNNVNELMMEEEDRERRKKLFLVGFWCIQSNPSDRPSITKVVDMLEGSVEAIQIPPKPLLFSAVAPDELERPTSSSSSSSEHEHTQNEAH